ncbi:MAG: PKD domain-containing protein [Planctomycetota bacterium]
MSIVKLFAILGLLMLSTGAGLRAEAADAPCEACQPGCRIRPQSTIPPVAASRAIGATANGVGTQVASVEQPVGTPLASGASSLSYGIGATGVLLGTKTFTIRNTGSSNLAVQSVTVDGANGTDFAVNTTGMLTTLTPAQITSFVVSFKPGAAGIRVGALHVVTDDPNTASFNVELTGGYLTQSTSQQSVANNSVSCNNGTGHTDNSYWRTFSLPAFGINAPSGLSVTAVQVGVETASATSGTQPITVNLYQTVTGTFPNGTKTLVGSAKFSVANQTNSTITIPVTGDVTAGGELIVEVFTPDGQASSSLFFIGTNSSPEFAPSYISAAACGIPNPTAGAAIGFPNMHYIINVVGTILGGNTPPTITGTVANQAVNDNTTIAPFSGVTLGDVDAPAQTQAVSVTLDVPANGSFTTLNGFTNAGGGVYTFSGTAASATTAIHGLVFTPTSNHIAPGLTETTTFTISINDGIALAVTNSTTTVISTSINDAPVLTSGPSATPNPAFVMQPVQFSAAASDADSDTLTYSWDFKDGSTSTQQNPTHAFTVSGTYAVSVTVTDGNGGSTPGIVMVEVLSGNAGEGDTDGDGFSDEIEAALKFDPFNSDVTPFKLPSPKGNAPISNSKLRIKLDFANANKDKLTLTGHLLVNGVIPVNQIMIVDVGGVVRAFTLNSTGLGKTNTKDKVNLFVKTSQALVDLTIPNFQVQLDAGSFAAALADEKLTNIPAKNVKRSVNVTIILLNTVFKATVQQSYSVRNSVGTTK